MASAMTIRLNETTRMTLSEGIAVVTVDSPPVNTLSAPVRGSLMQALAAAAGNSFVRAIVLLCEGRTFFAGADINELGMPVVGPDLVALERAIEASQCPVVAAMHGTALGGGLELALACHYRIAVPTAQLGLPEVMLGLLPGAGGTQRLPRLVGADEALTMIATGAPVSAQRALETGLIDAILPGEDLEREAVEFAKARVDRDTSPVLVRDRGCTGGDEAMFDRFRSEHPALFRGFRAPAAIVEALKAAVSLPFDEGIAVEAELFSQLLSGSESAAQRHIFFAERRSAKLPEGVRSVVLPGVANVALVGNGPLVDDLAQLFAANGIDAVQVRNPTGEGAMPPGEEAIAAADLIVLAGDTGADEGALLSQVGQAAGTAVVLARGRPSRETRATAQHWPANRVIGLDFLPSPREVRLIEVNGGPAACAEAAAIGMRLARRFGCATILSRGEGGAVVRRAMLANARCARALIRAGYSRRRIDQAMIDFGFPEGLPALAPQAFLPSTGGEAAFSSGEGAGVMLTSNRDCRARMRYHATPGLEGDLIERLLVPVVNECTRILGEGGVRAASDLDVGLVAGCGWPPYRGGPMFWADGIGLDRVVATLDALSDELGEPYRPTPFLRRYAAEQRPLSQRGTHHVP